ncbi:hypothetical protein FHETE_4026 [Fusarium heterosporum]|uniref:Uncharacterized protein n=1 Tax=Fusarium heterosporum TaxID=42747 RepID=A0A8H5WTK0_FUSHE|nr:hypothetical protein FHETE_4026 [Fusarium heterosporum]
MGDGRLPPRFGQSKRELVGDNGEAILDRWKLLVQHVKKETTPHVQELCSSIIPDVESSAILANAGHVPDTSKALLKESGTTIIWGVVLVLETVCSRLHKKKPAMKGFLEGDIQVFELYENKSQLEVRTHKYTLLAQVALNRVCSRTAEDRVVFTEAMAHCDRFRMRTLGDQLFDLEPHLDGGCPNR